MSVQYLQYRSESNLTQTGPAILRWCHMVAKSLTLAIIISQFGERGLQAPVLFKID